MSLEPFSCASIKGVHCKWLMGGVALFHTEGWGFFFSFHIDCLLLFLSQTICPACHNVYQPPVAFDSACLKITLIWLNDMNRHLPTSNLHQKSKTKQTMLFGQNYNTFVFSVMLCLLSHVSS